MRRPWWVLLGGSRRRDERGFAAVLVALLFPVVFLACAALSVDTARWYVEAENVQSAVDAAALAGVVWMPGDFDNAKSAALAVAKNNGFDAASPDLTVRVEHGEKASQLKVTISSRISNAFGSAIGTPTTVVSRSAVADYAGGLSMGSPCNDFGSDPDSAAAGGVSTNCSDAGDFWANVGGPKSDKGSGDAYQNGACPSKYDGCTAAGGTNTDYDANGYIYEVTVAKPVSNFRLEAFDPALIHVGDHCEDSALTGASSLSVTDSVVADPTTRYVSGDGKYCTGDNSFDASSKALGFNNQVNTSFTVRSMAPDSDPSRPLTWPILNTSTCPGAKTYRGYNGRTQSFKDSNGNVTTDMSANVPLKSVLNPNDPGYQKDVADTFRRWVTLCSNSSVQAGTTLAIQVKTNGLGFDLAAGHNRFALRAYSATSPSSNNDIAISAFNKMAVYANVKNGSSRFFLTRLPSSAAGQMLNVSLFDIGDLGGATGTLKFVAPAESNITFTNCRAVGKVNGTVSDCQFTADSTFNGRWQSVYIPIPSNYTCSDALATGCWVKLYYDFPLAGSPNDTTSWAASVDGQPVRLVQ
ncbi:MAG TPA: TadE/TadG family type IV pilus assembly protein [Nocardioidaceae bacterium]|nr:TadE/TadG family type IV pilus assembly protein [Nocardioidaceae bacterium]